MRATLTLLLLSGSIACGGEPSPAASAEEAPQLSAANSEGAEALPEPESEASAEPDDAPAPAAGPAELTVTALVAGAAIPAKVRVLDESGKTVVEGPAGSPLALESGSYRLEVKVSDATALADTPTQTRDLIVEPGQSAKVEARFPWAKVTLNVIIDGKSKAAAKVKLLREGNVVAEMKAGGEPVAISPGRYEAEVQHGSDTVRVKGLQFPEGATQTVPVRVQF